MLVPMYSFLEDLWWESLYVRHLGYLNSFRFRVFHAYSIKLETNGYSFSNASYSANSSYQLVKEKGIANLTSIVVCVVIFLITLKITQRRKNNKQKQATFRNILNIWLNFGIAKISTLIYICFCRFKLAANDTVLIDRYIGTYESVSCFWT